MGIFRAVDKSGKLLETFIGLENTEEAEAKIDKCMSSQAYICRQKIIYTRPHKELRF